MNPGIPGTPDRLRNERLYHGTRVQLRPGDLIQPGTPYVYLTPKLDEAIWDAEIGVGEGPGRVYVVEPTGEVAEASEQAGWKPPGHPSMSWCSRAPLQVTGEVTQWPAYHGTRADLKPGELIEPGYSSNYGKRTKAAYVYLARTLDAATWGAELAAGEGRGRIYLVEPTGPLEDDPNLTNKRFPGNPTQSSRSRQPLRVTGEIKQWQGHSPDALKAMKEGLAQLDRLGVDAIED